MEKWLRLAVVKGGSQEPAEARDCMWKQLMEVPVGTWMSSCRHKQPRDVSKWATHTTLWTMQGRRREGGTGDRKST